MNKPGMTMKGNFKFLCNAIIQN